MFLEKRALDKWVNCNSDSSFESISFVLVVCKYGHCLKK